MIIEPFTDGIATAHRQDTLGRGPDQVEPDSNQNEGRDGGREEAGEKVGELSSLAEVEKDDPSGESRVSSHPARAQPVENSPEVWKGESADYGADTIGATELDSGQAKFIDKEIGEDAETHRLTWDAEADSEGGDGDDNPTVEDREASRAQRKVGRPELGDASADGVSSSHPGR